MFWLKKGSPTFCIALNFWGSLGICEVGQITLKGPVLRSQLQTNVFIAVIVFCIINITSKFRFGDKNEVKSGQGIKMRN